MHACYDKFMDSRLYRVAKSGNVFLLLQLLNENPNLLTKLTPQLNTPLHIAVQFGHKSIVVEIYNRCRSLLTRTNLNGDTPLHVAARCGHLSILDFLVKEVLSPSWIGTENGKTGNFEILRQGNKENNTILDEAVGNGRPSVVELLLKVDPNLACFENHAGNSPLLIAAGEGMEDIVNQILISTPSSSHGGSEGQTALQAAVLKRHSGIMESLLKAKPLLTTEVDRHGRSPLHYAASVGDLRAVERLLELDTSLAYVLDKNGHSPMHVAARNGQANIIEKIIYHCPDSGELVDLNGRNALHVAVLSGNIDVVRCVLETAELEGVINQADDGGNTPLHLAAAERQSWILQYLMCEETVNQRARNKSGQSIFDINESLRESGLTYHSNKNMWRKLSRPFTWITKKKDPSCADQEAIPRTQTYKQMGNTLLMVATLTAAVTFAAAFTMPGGFNNDLGDKQGIALLESSLHLKWFVISDAIGMTCSILAACVIFWGTISSDESYAYYLASASTLTCIALQSTAIAFCSGIRAVLPDQHFVDRVLHLVGMAFHFCNFLFLVHLVRIFLGSEMFQFMIFSLWKMKSKMNKR